MIASAQVIQRQQKLREIPNDLQHVELAKGGDGLKHAGLKANAFDACDRIAGFGDEEGCRVWR